MVVLDTDIIIDNLRKPPGTDTVLKKIVRSKLEDGLSISVLSIQELYEGRSTKDRTTEQILLATISSLHILPYTFETAQLAGELARDLGRPIAFADAAIAATTLMNEDSLLTLNKKDFEGIRGLDLIKFA